MIDSVYSERILELAGNVGRLGRLAAPDASSRRQSRLCGSTITVDIRLEGGRIADYAQEVKACALGQAAAAVVAEAVVGASEAEVRAARDQLSAMLKQAAPPPDGRFAGLAELEPVRAFKARHASILLSLDALVDCLDTIARRRDGDS